MIDSETSVSQLKKIVADFVEERDWKRFHQPKNLAVSIMIEAAELLEVFQWDAVESVEEVKQHDKQMDKVREEVADVAAYMLSLCDVLDVDLSQALVQKMQKNVEKYPVEDCLQGKYRKD